jgi:hypothetical protein
MLDALRGTTLVTYAVAGPDAVYYSTARGIYRTAGGVPELFSGAVAGLFSGDTAVSSSIRTAGLPASLTWADRAQRLIATYANAASGAVRQLVYHAPSQQWTIWGLPASAPATLFASAPAIANVDSLAFEDSVWFVNGNDVWVWTSLLTAGTDGGASFSWSYKSGLYSLDEAKRVVVTLESRLTGTGTATLKVATAGGHRVARVCSIRALL